MDGGVGGKEQKEKKYPMVKNIYMFTNSSSGGRCSGLFKFKVQLSRRRLRGGGFEIGGPLVVKHEYDLCNLVLQPIQTFYDYRLLPQIRSVSACCVPDGPNLLVIPHDEGNTNPLRLSHDEISFNYSYFMTPYVLDLLSAEERDTLPPYSFDLKTNTIMDFPHFPHARKTSPLVMSLGRHRVFALSTCPSSPLFEDPDPCFESLDPDKNIWSRLDCPPFHNNHRDNKLCVTGFAVLEEEGYILVSVDFLTCCKTYSYNVSSGRWKPVELQTQSSSDEEKPSSICDQAVVIGNDIYTFFPASKKLFVFSYNTVTATTNCDVSLGVANKVEGLNLIKTDDALMYRKTGAVVQVDDQILCLLLTLAPNEHSMQDVLITFVELLGHAKCTTVTSFLCALSAGEELPEQTIKSCFVLDEPEKKTDQLGDIDCKTSTEDESDWDAEEWWVK